MKKLSYLLILVGVLLILFPMGRESYYDWKQDQLLRQMEGPADLSAQSSNAEHEKLLLNSFNRLNRLLDEGEDESDVSPAGNVDAKLLEDQNALGIITIDKIDVKLPILEGATKKNMKYAAAHLTETAPLGQNGNAAIAAHRAHTKGRLFNRLNEITAGDKIEIKLRNGQTETYTVYDISIVEPTEVSVLEGSDQERTLTLITCDPLVNPTHRLIVKARLDDGNTSGGLSALVPKS
ncbi:hypothetical protein AWM70_21255 [Paenibacillus yonginensis]|uniref:Sortase n=1 Tax=Paenibacillus yonginensis TaxID=1462996 RepID=A0A1B1N5W5_9BACL|nr:class D sortase [Paenibacillus yonginensis]ANS76797.1 hypothetical protein AWM70_21255 [Paenibacillus yonginensis]